MIAALSNPLPSVAGRASRVVVIDDPADLSTRMADWEDLAC
jgi:hypothetical protein